jgi:hypothetical protein
VQLLKNFPAFYRTRRFITLFIRALHSSLSWVRSVQSIPSHPVYLRSILILSTHLSLGLPSGLLLLTFPPISYMHSSSPHSCYMPITSHPGWLDYTWRQYISRSCISTGWAEVRVDRLGKWADYVNPHHQLSFFSWAEWSAQKIIWARSIAYIRETRITMHIPSFVFEIHGSRLLRRYIGANVRSIS